MKIKEIAAWYQKKIGTYDKQQWEETIEQRILHGLTHVQTKTAKPKTEFIDLDLIRGSSFPKAKPKHGLCTVARLSVQRLILFPFYTRWWIRQTSINVFKLLLFLYVLQFISITLYVYNWNEPVIQHVKNSVASSPDSEIIIPIILMFIMSFLHSLIVSTNPSGLDKKSPQNRHHRSKICRRTFNTSTPRSNNSCTDLRKTPSDANITNNKQTQPVVVSKKKIRSVRRTKINGAVTSTTTVITKRPLDEGFESLNGNGSSENGEDALDVNVVGPNSDKSINTDICLTPVPSLSNLTNGKNTLLASKQSSDEHESDTESEPEMLLRKRNVGSKCKNLVKTESDTDSDTQATFQSVASVSRRSSCIHKSDESSVFESDGHEADPSDIHTSPKLNEITASASEWIGITTNSEECSYSSESLASDSQDELNNNNDQFKWANGLDPASILSPSCAPSDLVSCTIWEDKDMKKADLSVLDISSSIIGRVETMPETSDYFFFGILFSIALGIVPILIHVLEYAETKVQREEQLSFFQLVYVIGKIFSNSMGLTICNVLGPTTWQRAVMLIALVERCTLAWLFFFQLAVAERTFKQRFLYAKLFSHLTSSRKARKSDLPHFRLTKVRNIKTWLSVRSYLKKRGPQRSVDVIVSAAFIITLLLMSFVSIELVKNSAELNSQYSAEACLWGLSLGVYLLRFMTLGTNVNSKYRDLSVLITEQINLYLHIEQKPHKKDELMVANSVLKLATDLLKELESPFKISGLSANPYLYTITKLVILSALSGVLSEMLGFKLKLHKLNIK